MSEKLMQAREYESRVSKEIPAKQRPVFHITPLVGWNNDPNGFSAFGGEYHLFYQYHPYSTRWGPMHWGHYKTRDFIKWETMPCALAPDTGYDGFGCFSGSAVEWQGKHYLMYTSVVKRGETVYQEQSVAVGDGTDYEKLPCNPVITADTLPEGSSSLDFRDPKLWQDGDRFYALIGSRSDDGSGQLALYSSENMEKWEFASILDRCNNEYGKMWECPDFFELDGKHVILVSPQEMLAEGLEFHNGNGSLCLIGGYDRTEHKFVRETVGAIDYGMDFYAAQTMCTPDGRRIMIAWMSNWENYMTPCTQKWSGFMTVPRELHVRNGKLYQLPVGEIGRYYSATYSFDSVQARQFTELSQVTGRVFDMTVELEPRVSGDLEIRLGANERFYTSLKYSKWDKTLTIDRTWSGHPMDLLAVRSMEVPETDGKVKLRILMDRYSVEVFVNDGEKAMTSLTYGPQDADRIFFQSDGPFDVIFHKIREDINH